MASMVVVFGLVIAVAVGVLLYRTQRHPGDGGWVAIGDLAARAVSDPHRRYGPDSDRVVDELEVLVQRHKDQTDTDR